MENKIEIDVGRIFTNFSATVDFSAAISTNIKVRFSDIEVCQRVRSLTDSTVAKLGGQNQIVLG